MRRRTQAAGLKNMQIAASRVASRVTWNIFLDPKTASPQIGVKSTLDIWDKTTLFSLARPKRNGSVRKTKCEFASGKSSYGAAGQNKQWLASPAAFQSWAL